MPYDSKVPSGAPPSYGEAVSNTTHIPPSVPPTPALSQDLNNLNVFRNLVQQHEIQEQLAYKLRQLENFDIVFICDDSGSMLTPCALGSQSPYAPRQTRWDELKQTLKTVVDIACTLDQDGIDVYFLNRTSLHNVTNAQQVEDAFRDKPYGYTPLANAFLEVLLNHAQPGRDGRKLLIVVATDGEPTTSTGQIDRNGVLSALRQRPDFVYTTFVALTDDDAVLSYLNWIDENVPRVDVVDDYASEKQQILAVQGPQFPFSRGDWVCKILLGSIDPSMDTWDERPVNRSSATGRRSTYAGGGYAGGYANRHNGSRTLKKKKGNDDCIVL
ncbi:hypothetical protein BC832DRAFT_202287 [Gaertneriomyces semiglobifer]|nr:hypothetical protein BC832DRAFT_202287 [Gaertneriomyces semiglobifer]